MDPFKGNDLEDLLNTSIINRLNDSQINSLYTHYINLNEKEKKKITKIVVEFYHTREYCKSRDIDYTSMRELKNPEVRKEVITDAYRTYWLRTH
tara:strand:- start:209 stop:490 length:282 start_codon:yes stop_codon:yes gene_type:complete